MFTNEETLKQLIGMVRVLGDRIATLESVAIPAPQGRIPCYFCTGTGMVATEGGGEPCVCAEPLLTIAQDRENPCRLYRRRVQWNTAARRLQETGDRTGRALGVLLEERLRAHPVSAGTCETLLLNADLAERVHAALDE